MTMSFEEMMAECQTSAILFDLESIQAEQEESKRIDALYDELYLKAGVLMEQGRVIYPVPGLRAGKLLGLLQAVAYMKVDKLAQFCESTGLSKQVVEEYQLVSGRLPYMDRLTNKVSPFIPADVAGVQKVLYAALGELGLPQDPKVYTSFNMKTYKQTYESAMIRIEKKQAELAVKEAMESDDSMVDLG